MPRVLPLGLFEQSSVDSRTGLSQRVQTEHEMRDGRGYSLAGKASA